MNRVSPELIQSYVGQRRKMVEEQLVERGVKNLSVLEAMSRVPRHLFAQDSLQHRAYGDTPLPIGENQTISQLGDRLILTDRQRSVSIGTVLQGILSKQVARYSTHRLQNA